MEWNDGQCVPSVCQAPWDPTDRLSSLCPCNPCAVPDTPPKNRQVDLRVPTSVIMDPHPVVTCDSLSHGVSPPGETRRPRLHPRYRRLRLVWRNLLWAKSGRKGCSSRFLSPCRPHSDCTILQLLHCRDAKASFQTSYSALLDYLTVKPDREAWISVDSFIYLLTFSFNSDHPGTVI